MSLPYARAPHTSGPSVTQPEAPNAALLIDFDNVTMGMRSDLSKELKTLLNSDIIKGKVTVQRAYADWRRYPQYIVPLSENSVDLIFAPAYGSSKKNATDIRMAIDGMELVFIRPEIGTFILLTGDSDFSSLVLKLKEYGKYVIGVGIQESSSDILVQNCDEYYSYTSLSGLRKTTDSANKPVDPWILVEEAVKKMDSRNDVMRSDRLKQVMMEIDPSFDEGHFGFSKFSKFLSEASGRNLVTLRKLENGQYEVQPFKGLEANGSKGKNGGSRKAESRSRSAGDRHSAGGRETRGKGGEEPKTAEKMETSPPDTGKGGPSGKKGSEDPLRAAYALLQEALDRLLEGSGVGSVRDSDLKRKMLEIEASFDEGELGFGKFSRFLRQAHDHEIIDLEKRAEGTYQVSPAGTGKEAGKAKAEPGQAESQPGEGGEPSAGEEGTAGGGTLRTRRGERGRPKEKDGPPPILEGQVVKPAGKGEAHGEGEEVQKSGDSRASQADDVDVSSLALPSGRAAVIRYLTNSYKGVGKKTAESLVDAFGGDLFKILQRDPDKIASVVPGKRAEQLLEAWAADYQRRRERLLRDVGGGAERGAEGGSRDGMKGQPPEPRASDSEVATEPDLFGSEPPAPEKKSPPKRRTRRGGRGRRQ